MSQKLGTKSLQSQGVSKTLLPGNSVCKVNSVRLEKFQFKENSYVLILNLESEPVGENFEGFFIDKDDPSLGRYLGQVGRVRAQKYPYSDAVTSKINISRDQEILKFIKNLCIATDSLEWFEGADEKFETIEEFVEAFNNDAPFKDVYLNFCLYGKEYVNRQGYTNFDLFLPKFTRQASPFESLKAKTTKLIKFNEKEGIIGKEEPKEVNSFDTTDNYQSSGFSLD